MMKQRFPEIVPESGFYFSEELNRITQLTEGEGFPKGGEWEFIGSLRDTSADGALSKVQANHPDVIIELVFVKK